MAVRPYRRYRPCGKEVLPREEVTRPDHVLPRPKKAYDRWWEEEERLYRLAQAGWIRFTFRIVTTRVERFIGPV